MVVAWRLTFMRMQAHQPTLVRALAPSVAVYRRVDLEITEVVHDNGHATLQMAGEMDVISAPLLPAVVAQVLEVGVRTVRLDLSRLRFCDCAGLRSVVEAHNEVARMRGTFVLAGLRPPVSKLLAITGLDEVLHIDEDAAFDAFRLKIVDDSGTTVRRRTL